MVLSSMVVLLSHLRLCGLSPRQLACFTFLPCAFVSSGITCAGLDCLLVSWVVSLFFHAHLFCFWALSFVVFCLSAHHCQSLPLFFVWAHIKHGSFSRHGCRTWRGCPVLTLIRLWCSPCLGLFALGVNCDHKYKKNASIHSVKRAPDTL